ncbi:hypothetical protein CwatDRAFT_2072 [Crocosphaera watsonii WH 8501]|uniref:Transposase DDE domain-containing protein n=1 Tax=Crocosphaera watsonii WH 8501 TaxID=165597 RepID=Q4C033_CROWT|nr:hypothetical protein CwatDRAFT_2072 [Crocosphaera watsonii WH 8501]
MNMKKKLAPITELMDSLFQKKEDLEEVKKLVPISTWYRSIRYKTEKSWSCQRRVVTKVCYGSDGLKMRHVVTSLPASKIPPSKLYTPDSALQKVALNTTSLGLIIKYNCLSS